jgi:homoserine acetyltransferase
MRIAIASRSIEAPRAARRARSQTPTRPADVCGTAQNTPDDFLLTETKREDIRSDPGWNSGKYFSNADVIDGFVHI